MISTQVDLFALQGKSVIVVGGASGLGLAIAKRFATAGAHITIADLDVHSGTLAATSLQQEGLSATFVRCDVTDHWSSVYAFEHAIRTSPSKSIDVAALMAGVIGEPGSFVDMILKSRQQGGDSRPPKLHHPGLDVNLVGIYNCAYLALWYMSLDVKADLGPVSKKVKTNDKSQFSKSLVLISSTVAYTDVPSFCDYHTSKFGIRGLFRNLRHETPRLNIRTNCIAPYFLDTPMVQNGLDAFTAAGMAPGKDFNFASVDRVVDVAAWFATDADVHGRAIAVLPPTDDQTEREVAEVVDLEDDEEGLWGGVVFKGVQERMRPKGNII